MATSRPFTYNTGPQISGVDNTGKGVGGNGGSGIVVLKY